VAQVVFSLIVIIVFFLERVFGRGGHKLLVNLEHLGLGIVADQANIGGDDAAFL
jgi:hypothetical protein